MKHQITSYYRGDAERKRQKLCRFLDSRLCHRIFKRPITKAVAAGILMLLVSFPSVSGATFRWASSSNRIYVESGGSATLSQIKAALPNAPLYLIDAVNKVWFLRANLFVADGCTLLLHGSGVGGDVNELRLLSNNSTAPNSYVCVDADWGTLDLGSTKVTSWNEAKSAPDTEYVTFQRAFVRARSRKTGTVITQSTLNVVNSEIAYLGYNYREGYGLTWQVVSSVKGVTVFGTVSGSYIHDCQLGVGTWSVDDVSWTGSEIASNTLYGFDGTDSGHQAVLATNNVHDNDYGATFRWSSTSQRIYVTGPGSGTLTDIKAALPTASLTLVDPTNMIWYLGVNLFVENGARLKLYGPSADGDVAELRLKSENTTNSDAIVELRADWGWLDILNTKITSWNSAANGPDTETDTYRRAYIRARSSLDPDGVTPHESRMDVVGSDIGYLGSHNTEAYGLVWKVVDTVQTNLPPGKTLFDLVNVYGDILNSRLHHCYFGMYSYGQYGGHWANNEADHNIGYGFDPHDDSDYLVIENNNVHHNGWHGIIASKRCDHLIIRNNVSWANQRNGIMLHRHCNDSLIEGNRCFQNGDSGIALFANSRTVVTNNLCLSNSNAGIRFSVGATDNLIEGNEFGYSGKYGCYFYAGGDTPELDDTDALVSARNRRNQIVNNLFHHSVGEGIKLTDGDENVFVGNAFLANGSILRFTTSALTQLISNSIPANVIAKLAGSAAVPSTVLFKAQPLINLDLEDVYSSATLEDDTGAIFDFDEGSIFTGIDGNGSFVTLSSAQIGVSTTAVTRNLFASVDTGSALINPTQWAVTGDLHKVWTTRAGLTSQTINYLVGDLAPGSVYTVFRDGLPLMSVNSDSAGRVGFWDLPGTINPVTYSVTP